MEKGIPSFENRAQNMQSRQGHQASAPPSRDKIPRLVVANGCLELENTKCSSLGLE